MMYTDGSHIDGVGGWAWVLGDKSGSGKVPGGGPNVMELQAIVEGLDQLPRPSSVLIHTDSLYVIVGTTRKRRRGELWDRYRDHCYKHWLVVRKIKGHHKHKMAHHLAREAISRGN